MERYTLFVNNMTINWRSGSPHTIVPVYPVCINVRGDKDPHDWFHPSSSWRQLYSSHSPTYYNAILDTKDVWVIGIPPKCTATLRVVILLDEIFKSSPMKYWWDPLYSIAKTVPVHVSVIFCRVHQLRHECEHISCCREQSSMSTNSSISIWVIIFYYSLPTKHKQLKNITLSNYLNNCMMIGIIVSRSASRPLIGWWKKLSIVEVQRFNDVLPYICFVVALSLPMTQLY